MCWMISLSLLSLTLTVLPVTTTWFRDFNNKRPVLNLGVTALVGLSAFTMGVAYSHQNCMDKLMQIEDSELGQPCYGPST